MTIVQTKLPFVLAAWVAAGGCATPPKGSNDDLRRMFAAALPNRIRIIEPFTGVASFDEDDTPDGIEVLLQPVNSFDDPGLVVGSLLLELYEYVPASADHKGRRLEHWKLELATAEDQKNHWNSIKQMYELRLRVNPELIPRANQYVLNVTYTSPLGDHLSDECRIDYGQPAR